MKKKNEKNKSSQSKRKKLGKFIFILLFNFLIIACIATVYIIYTKANNQALFNENITSINYLNAASANAAYSYATSMENKIVDSINYIKKNNLSFEATLEFLKESNTNPDRQFQLVLCGTYGRNGELSFGDYSGTSIRKIANADGSLSTVTQEIIYGSGYYNILHSLLDVNDSNSNNSCFTPEFTDPDTKLKCFAAYRHIVLSDSLGKKRLYAIFLAVNSLNALNSYNKQNKYVGQSTVLIDQDGTYIIKNNDYRNTNFYDYIVNYNGLSLDWKSKLQYQVFETTNSNGNVIDLFYKNHKGNDCVFSIIRIDNGWYSITCTPLSSFKLQNTSINFSLIILLLFVVLFIFDGIIVLYLGKIMEANTKIAESATQTANQANLAKSRFLSTMSHELRTPLNAIIGFVSLCKDILDDPIQLKDYLEKITISSKLLLQLISDILDISAIESNKLKINNGEFNINSLITALSTIFYNQCSNKGIEFNVILKNIHSDTLIGDSTRVNQILLNFLSNSVKFTPSGGKIVFKIEAIKREETSVVIKFTISDTGCGISDELKSRLFQPFERATGDKAHKYSGTGLGLSISKNLIELMDGEVGVDSVEGAGSTFWTQIPFNTPEKIKTEYYSPINDLRIVAAINNIDEREYFGQMLTNFGVSYDLVSDAESVIELLNNMGDKNPYNLCILDWKMSDLSAQSATFEIRKKFKKDTLKIVVLAYDLTSAKPLSIEAGATFVLGKPVFSSSLYNFLQEITTDKVQPTPDTNKDYNLKGKRVLLVEDNNFNIEVAKLILDKFKLSVETATNGQEAFNMFYTSSNNYYDLILMDIQMPIMNGYEATKTIRASTHFNAKTIPILAMTADAFSEDIEKSKKAGMNEHISKPIEPDNLYSVLKKYLS